MNINSIQLSIGSAFTGEGFQKAKAAVMDVNNNVKRAAGDATRLAGAFGEMDASAAKAMGAATGLVHALASFSITTIAVQGTMMAINLYLGELRERADAAKKKADELAASVKAAFDSTLTTRMGALQKEVKDIGDGFERVAKQAKSFSDALEGVRSSQAAGGIASLEVEKLNKMLEAHTDAERITIEKSYALLVAQARLTEAEQAGAEKIQAVTDEMQTNQKRLGVIDDQLAKLREDRAQLEEAMFSAKASEDKNWLEIQKRVNELKAQEETLEQKRIDTENAAEILELKLQKTKEDANTAQLNATAAVKQAELAQRDAAKQIQDRADKEKLAAAASEEQKLKDAELRDAKYTYTEKLKDAATIQKEANDAAKALEAAQRAYMSALDGYMSSGAALSGVFGANKSGMGKSGAIPVNVVRGVSMQVSDARVDDAIRRGLVNTVKDADRLQREAQRAVRNQLNKDSGQRARESQRYERLMKMQPKDWSKSDADFVRKFEKIQEAQEAAKRRLQNAEKEAKDALDAQKKTAKAAEALDKRLQKLGLK